MAQAIKTTDHTEIQQWAKERGARPARVKGTGGEPGGILRFDFGEPEESLEEISWDEFFEVFEDRELALLHQDETEGGRKSRFNKLVSRKDA